MRSLDDFLAHYRRQRAWTRALVRAIPDEHFGWAPAPDAFSCGDLVRHLIQAEGFWRKLLLAAVAGEKHDPFGLGGSATERMAAFRPRNLEVSHSPRLGETAAACLAAWEELQERNERELATITPEQLSIVVEHPLTRLRAPLWEMLLVVLEHEAHHRGQLSAYLKMLGVPQPPVFGLDGEELA